MSKSPIGSVKKRPILTALICVLVSSFSIQDSSHAQTVEVVSAPRTFTVTTPPGWVAGPLATGNSRVVFNSKEKKPFASCAVISNVSQHQGATQDQINATLLNPMSKEAAEEAFQNYNNVKVLSVNSSVLSGYPSQVVKVQVSMGTPDGELWSVVLNSTTATAPNVVWSVNCGATGKSLAEAQKAYSHWQVHINNFASTFKIK